MLILGRMQLPCVSEKDAFAGLFPGRNFVVHTHNIDGYDVMNYIVTCLHVFWKFDIHPVKDWFKDLKKKVINSRAWNSYRYASVYNILILCLYSRNYVCLFVHSCFLIGHTPFSLKLMLFFFLERIACMVLDLFFSHIHIQRYAFEVIITQFFCHSISH